MSNSTFMTMPHAIHVISLIAITSNQIIKSVESNLTFLTLPHALHVELLFLDNTLNVSDFKFDFFTTPNALSLKCILLD
jgi:hypothetical protein